MIKDYRLLHNSNLKEIVAWPGNKKTPVNFIRKCDFNLPGSYDPFYVGIDWGFTKLFSYNYSFYLRANIFTKMYIGQRVCDLKLREGNYVNH